MAQTFLVFDFGANEETAQQARLTLERWKQSFRLDKKLLLKFDREEAAEAEAEEAEKGTKKKAESAAEGRTFLIVRLDFSDHEKLSHQRWGRSHSRRPTVQGCASQGDSARPAGICEHRRALCQAQLAEGDRLVASGALEGRGAVRRL